MKKWKYLGLAALCLALALAFAHIGPYGVARMFAGLGRGPEFLYAARDYRRIPGEADFTPGARWFDADGNLIQAHGGQVQRMPVPDESGKAVERYVWIGENKTNGSFGNCFTVYVSDDLYSWECRGDALRSVDSREQLERDPYFAALYGDCTGEELDEIYRCINADTVMERPKLLYCPATGKYVLWFHSDDATEANPGYKYDVGMAGVAVSDSPFGPFRFLRRQRLSRCPEGEIDCYPSSRGEARDMNLFCDSDGTGYIVYTSENNKTLYISKLREDFTALCAPPEEAVAGRDFARIFPGAMREAPVLARGDDGRYYLISSSTTGWMSNQARAWSADEIFGEWRSDGNPCAGSGAGVTFDTQSTCLFQAPNGQWIYFGDRWNTEDLSDSRYVWLPARFEGGRLEIEWRERWRWEEQPAGGE